MMKPIDIKEVKQIEITLLNAFARVCEENHLRYYLAYGTLLGAVRHGGFIPWDDDIDVVMPRPDFERMKEILIDNLVENKYKLLTYKNGSTKYNFMKFIDNRTVLEEKYVKEQTGVWIDVFPIDGLPDNYLLNIILCLKLQFWRRLLNISMARPGMGSSFFHRIVKCMAVPLVKKIPGEFLCEKVDRTFQKYEYDTCRYVGAVSTSDSYHARVERKAYDTEYISFEGKKYRVPKGRHKILTQSYGDYMKLPPEEERVQHEFKAYWKDEAVNL